MVCRHFLLYDFQNFVISPPPITILVAYKVKALPLQDAFDSGQTWLEGCLGGYRGTHFLKAI